MEVEVISKECILPSSPTPVHLRNFKLSLLDQLIPVPYAPIVFFYPINDLNTSTSSDGHLIELSRRRELLKSSLSETLTRFYPLAGKINDDLSIDCSDEGAYYVEARVNCHLSSFLSHPDLLLIHKFLPCEAFTKESTQGTYVTNIQVNIFECGGIAIGLCISHKILDGAALSTFLKSWTASAQGCNNISPDFNATPLFPTNDLWLRDLSMVMWDSLLMKGKCVTKRFVFDALAIATLKAKVTNFSGRCPTKVEAVSAFIWKSAMAASEQKHGFSRPSLLTHVVNLRKRVGAALPLSDHSIGNLLWTISAQCNMDKIKKPELHGLVGKIRESISRVDADLIQKLRGGDKGEGYSIICESLNEIRNLGSPDGVDYFGFTSWCKSGHYEVDFGWGKPIWVSSVGKSGGSVFLNIIVLIDTKCGEGIEAWMTLDEQDIDILEHDMELLSFASVDPSPLNLINHSLTLC